MSPPPPPCSTAVDTNDQLKTRSLMFVNMNQESCNRTALSIEFQGKKDFEEIYRYLLNTEQEYHVASLFAQVYFIIKMIKIYFLNPSWLNIYLILRHFFTPSFASIQFFFLVIRFLMCSTTWSGRFFTSFSRVRLPKRQCSFLVTTYIRSTVLHLPDYEKLRSSRI